MLQSLLRSRKFSLRLILVVPFVLQTAAVVSLTGWISLHNGQKEINDLSSELQSKTTRKVTRYLDSYLLVPHQINQTNLAAINLKLVNPADLRTTGQFFWKQMQIFNVGCINFGKVQGEFVGVERRNNGEFLYHEILRASPNKTSVYRVDLQGRRASLKNVLTQQTGVQTETWFMDAMRSGRPVWSRIYQWQSKPDLLSISSSYPVYDDSQKLLGVIGVNLILSQVGDFLRSLKTSPSGQTFIVERDGLLVASSTAQLPFELVAGQAQRIKASQSSEGVMRSTLQHLNQHFGTLHKIQNAQQLNFHLSGVKQFVSVTPWKDQYGLDWLIVVVVPESDFTEETYQNIRLTILLCLMALGGASTIGIATSTMLVQPILRMVNTANALSAGDWQQQVSESRISEISLLATALNRMAGQLQSSFTTLIYTASHDSLTGLLSRNSFQQKLQEAILHYQESNQATLQSSHSNLFAVLFLDLDHFKFVNDSLGHMVGDQLLVSVARRLSLCLRSIDVIGRFGGDEFIILLNHVANITDVTRVSDRILAEFQQPFNILGNEIFIGVSIGIVLSTIEVRRSESFLRNADIALHHAKLNGKASYEIFNAEMHTRAVERLQLETDLRRAIEREEFEVCYQPIVHLETRRVSGFEALVRWNHPTQGQVSPAKFIPIAEETGLIVKLGSWVLRQACAQMWSWQQQFSCCHSMVISVNLSGRQFLQIDLLEQIERILSDTHLPPQSLKLEITESVFMLRGEVTQAKVKCIKELGIQISVDDFGTGYSSLSYLHRFPADTLKIDSSFIYQLAVNPENLAIVEAIVVLAHKLGMDVIAEGVETNEQLEQLRAIHCEQVQGYLFSPPLSADESTKLLQTRSSCGVGDQPWGFRSTNF